MFRAEVIADDSGTWTGNGIMFGTQEEAVKWVQGLFSWPAVRKWRVLRKSDVPRGWPMEGIDEVVKEGP